MQTKQNVTPEGVGCSAGLGDGEWRWVFADAPDDHVVTAFDSVDAWSRADAWKLDAPGAKVGRTARELRAQGCTVLRGEWVLVCNGRAVAYGGCGESPNAQDQVARTPGGATGTRNPEGLPASPGSALAWQEGITPAFGWWWHRFYALQRPTRAYVHTDGRGETWAEIEGKCGLMRCGFEGGQGQWAGPYESPAARDAAFSPNNQAERTTTSPCKA